MSFSEQRTPWWFHGLVILYIAAAMIWGLGNLFVYMMGPCPAFSSNTVCEWSSLKSFWHFPGSQILSICLGFALFVPLKKRVSR